jgi:hypothetical protein
MIKLTIYVDDVSTVIAAGFTQCFVYRADSETGTYVSIHNFSLVAGTSTYYHTDATGDATKWYKSRYYNPTAAIYSSYSDPVQGEEAELFHSITYPQETYLGTSDETKVKKIRVLIGDAKEVRREYQAECQSSVSEDGHTYELDQKGWPLYISLSDIEMTSSANPYFDGYRYLTFSGTIGETDSIDIWYYTFRWSDSEIIDHYNNTMIPPGLTSSTVSMDHLILQAAIDLLEAENWRDYIENGARISDSDTEWDPSPGYRARESAIKRLQKRLDDLVKQYTLVHYGWRID